MSNPIIPKVSNETGILRTVVFGLPDDLGPEPTLEETYDAKSYDSLERGIYPSETDIKREMQKTLDVLNKYQVEVLRPNPIKDYNQIFARDVAFTIDDTLFVSNLISDRELETNAFSSIFERVASTNLERLPKNIHVEGGDVILYDNILFIGTYLGADYSDFKTARTNQYAIDYFVERFPKKDVIPIQLRKHDKDPRKSVLHLDCAFQPVGRGHAICYPKGFLYEEETFELISEIFGRSNLFSVTTEEAVAMTTNIFSLRPDVVISEEGFDRLNNHLESAWGIVVERVPYHEISKLGGLLRCSTMPLIRE